MKLNKRLIQNIRWQRLFSPNSNYYHDDLLIDALGCVAGQKADTTDRGQNEQTYIRDIPTKTKYEVYSFIYSYSCKTSCQTATINTVR